MIDNNIEFDEKKIKEINRFLDRLYKITREYNNSINSDIIYNELKRYGLKDSDIDLHGKLFHPKELFSDLNDYFRNRPNLRILQQDYWLGLISRNDDHMSEKEFIKLYIPIAYNHLSDASKQLFDFVEQLNVYHESKINKEIRSDNIIIRLKRNDFDSARKIISFINSNQIIKKGLNRPNPFIPTINGVGYMVESGESYSRQIAILLTEYLNDFCNNHKGKLIRVNKPTVEEFYNLYIKKAEYYIKSYKYSSEVKNTFLDLLSKNKLFYSKMRLEERNQKNEQRYKNIYLFLESIKATYKKYGINQARYAIIRIINDNDYDFITNETPEFRYREQLKSTVSPTEIKNYIKTTLNIIDRDLNDNDIDKYLFYILSDELVETFKQCCIVTLEKYNKKQLITAINKKIFNNDSDYFSKYSSDNNQTINYREIIKNYTPEVIRNAMLILLSYYGIDKTNSNNKEIIGTYVDLLEKSVQKTPKKQKK